MKAVVMEVKDGYAAVLSEDGQFIKIEDAGYTIGMELSLEEKNLRKNITTSIKKRNKRYWQSAAAIAAALLIVIGINDFNTPYGVVSLDVNPSIEISINRYDRVLDVEAVNADAEAIVEKMNSDGIRYKAIEDAVDMALNSFSEGDYAADDGTTYVMIASNNEDSEHAVKIIDSLEDVCKSHEDISAQTIAADDELVERARELGTTAGKLYLVDTLKDVSEDDNFDESDWLRKPVKEIIHEIDISVNEEGVRNSKEPADDIEKTPDVEKTGQISLDNKNPAETKEEADYGINKPKEQSDHSTDKTQEKVDKRKPDMTDEPANVEADSQPEPDPEQEKLEEQNKTKPEEQNQPLGNNPVNTPEQNRHTEGTTVPDNMQ